MCPVPVLSSVKVTHHGELCSIYNFIMHERILNNLAVQVITMRGRCVVNNIQFPIFKVKVTHGESCLISNFDLHKGILNNLAVEVITMRG